MNAFPRTAADGRPSESGERWLGLVAGIAGLLLGLPVITVAVLALTPTENIWPRLYATVLPGYVWQTLVLMAGVGAISLVTGTVTAWLVTMYRFPGRKVFQWALLVPMATPTYIIAYTYVDLLNYAGPVQTWLRALSGWRTPADYMFPEIRSLGGAIFVLSMVLYPYVFLTARASFLRQPTSQLEVARTLGQSAGGAFFAVALPQARPAIAVGVSLALMECLNDIGAVGFFGVRTLSLGIYTTWLAEGNLGGASQIAAVMLVFVFALLWIERSGRRHQRFALSAQKPVQRRRTPLLGVRAWAATAACLAPIVFGFFVPGLVLVIFAAHRLDAGLSWPYLRATWHSLMLSVLAAAIAVIVGLALAYAHRLTRSTATRQLVRLASIGYAVPGTVLGIGVLIPLAAFDNALDGIMRESFGISTGLLLSGSIAAVTFAYVVRFLAVSLGSIESGLERVTPNLAAVARTLGRGPFGALREVHLPLLRPAIVAAALLVFVDCMKELPATLILRPFDFETLATTVFMLASLDQLEESALPALTIVAVGFIPVIMLSRTLRDPRIMTAMRAGP
jgi:iron(III) transport system permease protein